jgi:hypothetical protein
MCYSGNNHHPCGAVGIIAGESEGNIKAGGWVVALSFPQLRALAAIGGVERSAQGSGCAYAHRVCNMVLVVDVRRWDQYFWEFWWANWAERALDL